MELSYAKAVRNSSAYRAVERDIERGEMGHAYLFVSGDRDALDTLLTLVACRIYCPTACLTCAECRKVLQGSKPDVKHLAVDDAPFTVAEMEQVVEDAGLTSFENCDKTYVFHAFENVGDASQNKLLKTLEEPFDGVHFLLGTSNPAAVLPTVLSRTKQVQLSAFSVAEVQDGLIQCGISKADAQRAARLGQGNFTLSKAIATDADFMRHVAEVIGLLGGINTSADVYKFLRSPVFGKERVKGTLTLAELVLSDVLNYHYGLPVVISDAAKSIAALSDAYSPRAIGEILDLMPVARRRLKANCLTQGVADWLMLKIVEVKYKCRQ